MTVHKFDIICLSETYLDYSIPFDDNSLEISGYYQALFQAIIISGWYLWFLVLLWLVPFYEGSKMISTASRRYSKFFAVVQVISYIVPYGCSYQQPPEVYHEKNVFLEIADIFL